MEPHRSFSLGRCKKLLSKIARRIFSKKPGHAVDTLAEKPTSSTCEIHCDNPIPSPVLATDRAIQPPASIDFTPKRLHRTILRNVSNGIEGLLVVSAQHCNETTGNGTSILVKVVDSRDSSQAKVPLVLDHNSSECGLLGNPSTSPVYLKISSDDTKQTLKQCCAYNHYKSLESTTLNLSAHPLPLYKLAVLAEAVSSTTTKHDRKYHRHFATSIWSCVKEIQPGACQLYEEKRAFPLSRSGKHLSEILSRYHHEVSLFELKMKRIELGIYQCANEKQRHKIEALNEGVLLLREQLHDMASLNQSN
ncbi:hypothetical protein BDV93DRAFT_529496, partial [Ceratobasidium sp. AG-I]